MSEDDPHEDFGDEPFTAEDAVQRAPAFIDRCCKILTGAGPFPYASMSVRTLTFAMQFKD